jgi:hypothetical protein
MILTKEHIVKQLAFVPQERLPEIDLFIQFILFQTQSKPVSNEPKTLAGIWQNIGFENLIDLDSEVNNMRTELGTKILNIRL